MNYSLRHIVLQKAVTELIILFLTVIALYNFYQLMPAYIIRNKGY